jgi:hypothetical protein
MEGLCELLCSERLQVARGGAMEQGRRGGEGSRGEMGIDRRAGWRRTGNERKMLRGSVVLG